MLAHWCMESGSRRLGGCCPPLPPLAGEADPGVGGTVVKNPSANARDATDVGSVPGWDPLDPLKEEMATHFYILAWEITWTEWPSGPQSMESQNSWI